MEKPQKWFAGIRKTHLPSSYRCVFLFVYLLKNITNIIKANTIIVSIVKAYKNRYMNSNKTASIIAPPPF